jgi:hypothetical protein
MDLFRTIETIFVPGWTCFVPLKLFLYQSGTKIVSIVRNRSIRVFLCFRGVQLETHSTFFTTKNESKFVLCATGCTPRMDLFRTIETFFVPAKKSFNSTKPLRILRIL